ncbi:FAD-dependent thymidylate synthase [Desulfurobacterium atlanticum]|uniref:FAD-dependent thymidylate synthase n=1 Tax=Desulfurobacterium atlanticum TaxID=240169 RepID=A0A238ZMS5_9BACT|nr:FAD-dependent thymidylate synthase [Desulfurobacterium atlanticum]SNR84351.1 thymidylate synthase (FAD) [Desulfurobacterium atlanticum]
MKVILISKNIPEIDIDTSELEKHIAFTFLVDGISRACSHQLVRHRLASYSQQSQRYVSMKNFPYVTPPSIENKNISFTVNKEKVSLTYNEFMNLIGEAYGSLIEQNIPKEDARFILPNSCATRVVFTMNGKELIHFLKLRTCNRAQWEIREMALEILKIVREVLPEIFKKIGPECFTTGICPEGEKTCGKKEEVINFFKSF